MENGKNSPSYHPKELFNVYALYDTVAEEYGNPIIARNDGMIKRILVNQLAKTENKDDYELYHIAHYSIGTGDMISMEHRKIHLGMIKETEVEGEKNWHYE